MISFDILPSLINLKALYCYLNEGITDHLLFDFGTGIHQNLHLLRLYPATFTKVSPSLEGFICLSEFKTNVALDPLPLLPPSLKKLTLDWSSNLNADFKALRDQNCCCITHLDIQYNNIIDYSVLFFLPISIEELKMSPINLDSLASFF